MKIENSEAGIRKVSICLTRTNGRSCWSFHISGTNMEALEAGFKSIEENELNKK